MWKCEWDWNGSVAPKQLRPFSMTAQSSLILVGGFENMSCAKTVRFVYIIPLQAKRVGKFMKTCRNLHHLQGALKFVTQISPLINYHEWEEKVKLLK